MIPFKFRGQELTSEKKEQTLWIQFQFEGSEGTSSVTQG